MYFYCPRRKEDCKCYTMVQELCSCTSSHDPLFPKLRDVFRIITELSQHLFAIVCHPYERLILHRRTSSVC
jgi:hypothetical protein